MGAHSHFLWMDLFSRENSAKRNLINVLKENVLFKTLSLRELKYLANLVYERVYQPNEPIFQQNDRGLGMYLIAKGKVAIKSPTPEGEVLVTTLQEGNFFGEIALVDPDNMRSASAVAAERCMIIGFFKPDLMEILERKPTMGVKILFQLSTILGRRLLETTERIAQMTRSPIHSSLRRGERLEKTS
ncbi:MAG: cyclic nucleotide-binding domain-containing protein [Bdellovibrio sp.]|nr:cyclic nucleotide-binding domain-containing protein [Bdellovibrio sp.]